MPRLSRWNLSFELDHDPAKAILDAAIERVEARFAAVEEVDQSIDKVPTGHPGRLTRYSVRIDSV